MRMIDNAALLRYLSIMNGGEIDFFLGSGASAQAGIPTGSTMIWEFKRELYCSETGNLKEMFRDLNSDITRNTLQKYFDDQGNHPPRFSPDEYAHYFELCHPTAIARERYIQDKVSDIAPSIGHLCLADLCIKKRIVNIWTTNFDELIESGIKALVPHHSFNVYSSANKSVAASNSFSSVIKLHGDYRYDHIKNTTRELQILETTMQDSFTEKMKEKGLVVLGYSGSDESIMNVFEQNLSNPEFLKFGLIWAVPEGVSLSPRLSTLLENACKVNENSGIIEIQGFDEFLHSIYANQSTKNEIIENGWRDYDHKKLPIHFQPQPTTNFTKLNGFESISCPECFVFDTNITSWKQLRDVIGDNDIIAALYSHRLYCFEDFDEIKRVFGSHIKSQITKERISGKILYRTDSIYLGMIYSLINKVFISDFRLTEFRRNKYYNSAVSQQENDLNCLVYDAIEISLSVYNGKIYLNAVPTVFLTDNSGNPFERFDNQKKINQVMSKVYNSQYNERLKFWNEMFIKNRSFEFTYKGFSILFSKIPVSCGGNSRKNEWPIKYSFHFNEPEMLFDIRDTSKKSVNQLKGISSYAPLDCSFSVGCSSRSSITLAIVSPQEELNKILNHLAKLNQCITPTNSRDGFLTQYSGFETIYKRALSIPACNDTSRIYGYATNTTMQMKQSDFLALLKRFIDQLSTQHDYDVAVIYIPEKYARFREDVSSDYNLHDAIKLYATDKSVKVQFVEERSINYYDPCKVMWGLSTSLYAKASGILWQPAIINNDTAFVGISYAMSKSKGTCIGCSQLFDSTGTGIRLLLKKINDPGFWGRNPYMKSDEARLIMSALRDQYYKCEPTSHLKRIVVHKTTPFTQEEIKGFTQALEGIEDIELLQIQEYSTWRAIRYDSNEYTSKPASFAIHRGTTIPLDDDCFLLWTHGCIQHDDLLGNRLNYYKGGRGIPSPLLVKRYYGKASGDVLVNEILMLSKMNWNSGDSLYKQLPVTLDFAKVLSRMSKQDEAIYNKPYDFRYFM